MEHVELTLPVRFLSAGQFIARKGWIHPRRALTSYTLFLVERGCFAMVVDGTQYILHPREALLLPPGKEHAGIHIKDEAEPVYYWAHFTCPPKASPEVRKTDLDLHTDCRSYDRTVISFHQLISVSRGSCPSPLECDFLMSLVLVCLQGDSSRDALQKPLISRLKEYLRINCHQNITLQELSQTFHYSTDYISRIFRKYEGMPISRYLHTLRLTEAKQLLLTTTDSVRQISFRCGYANEKFFITTFVNYEGMSPTQYRNSFSILYQNDQ